MTKGKKIHGPVYSPKRTNNELKANKIVPDSLLVEETA